MFRITSSLGLLVIALSLSCITAPTFYLVADNDLQLASLTGEWEGKSYDHRGGQEWIQCFAAIPGKKYEAGLMPKFNPSNTST